MNKIIKYLLISFFVYIFFAVNIFNYKANNSFIIFKDNISSATYNNSDNEIDSGKFFFMELFCGAIGVLMIFMALKK